MIVKPAAGTPEKEEKSEGVSSKPAIKGLGGTGKLGGLKPKVVGTSAIGKKKTESPQKAESKKTDEEEEEDPKKEEDEDKKPAVIAKPTLAVKANKPKGKPNTAAADTADASDAEMKDAEAEDDDSKPSEKSSETKTATLLKKRPIGKSSLPAASSAAPANATKVTKTVEK
jgi:hypothetical protein